MKNMQLDHDAHPSEQKTHPICFLAHDMDSPANIGSLFRIADALGVERIFLTGRSPIPPNSKIKKTSRSTEKYVNYKHSDDPISIVESLRKAGYRIISLEITSNSVDIKDFQIHADDKICLILGSENEGICQELLDVSDACIHIPMQGKNSSMNVANACAIATYELTRRL